MEWLSIDPLLGLSSGFSWTENTVTRQVEGGTGEGNQNALEVHCGLGDTDLDNVDLTVTWPGRKLQQVKGLQVNQRHHIRYQKQDDLDK